MTYAAAKLQKILASDQFDDTLKRESLGDTYYPADLVKFIEKWAKPGLWADIGAGTGGILEYFPVGVTHLIEPSKSRLAKAKKRAPLTGYRFHDNFVEDLPKAWAARFATVTHLYGFFQVRSDAEALIEINRVLVPGGRFIVNVPLTDLVVNGRSWHKKNLIQWFAQFGFHFEAASETGDIETTVFSFTKAMNFCGACYLMPQFQLVTSSKGLEYVTVANHSSAIYWLTFHKVPFELLEAPLRSGPVRIKTKKALSWRFL